MADGRGIATAPPTADHAAHDLLLVAEAADRGGRLPAGQASCPDCRALHADLVALAAAAPTAALPTRPHDYRLTAADAARLRPAGWRRWWATIGTSRDTVTRPLAIGLTTLGLAGLLVATVPGALPGAGSSAGSLEDQSLTMLAAPAASAGPVAWGLAPSGGSGIGGGAAALAPTSPVPMREAATADGGVSPLVVLSGSMAVAGGTLFAIRRMAPRRRDVR